ncbi:hypothetical protein DPM33_30165 [Mesorhizobium hawassense]|uniref:Uncharacterized protein n=1 Tax=Mesorhizobium hawassense TaxID=1209954 RepID=A0A330H7V5_9HYPH|nr:hypothetical protein DPM33_30165 [Mesorhizobium hawassense]
MVKPVRNTTTMAANCLADRVAPISPEVMGTVGLPVADGAVIRRCRFVGDPVADRGSVPPSAAVALVRKIIIRPRVHGPAGPEVYGADEPTTCAGLRKLLTRRSQNSAVFAAEDGGAAILVHLHVMMPATTPPTILNRPDRIRAVSNFDAGDVCD